MEFTNDSIQIQTFISKFDMIACETLTKTQRGIIKSFFVKINKNHYDKPHCISRLIVLRNHTLNKNDLFNNIPSEIRSDIHTNYNTLHLTKYAIQSKTITYNIYNKTELSSGKLDNMIYKMNLWLSIAIEHANNKCSNELEIHIFLTGHKKMLPENDKPTNTIHVNTALTSPCSHHNRIYIYRREEWFKVFIHETFHCLGLDFSHMDTSESNKTINTIFSTNIPDIRLYESYCEIWAETFNLIFVAFFLTPSKINYDYMFKLFQNMYNEELTFSIYQMVTILKKHNLRYSDLVHSKKGLTYVEYTNTFSYYILKSIIMFNMNDFITWCSKHNSNIINFTHSQENISKYCDFIEECHANEEYLKTIKYIEEQNVFKLRTLRMTAFELL